MEKLRLQLDSPPQTPPGQEAEAGSWAFPLPFSPIVVALEPDVEGLLLRQLMSPPPKHTQSLSQLSCQPQAG